MAVPNLSLSEFRELRPMEHIHLVTDYCASREDLKTAVDKILQGKYKFPEKFTDNLRAIEENIFFKVDGKAYLRIADAIKEWVFRNSPKIQAKTYLISLVFYLMAGIRTVLKILVKGYAVPKGKKIEYENLISIAARIQKTRGKTLNIYRLPLSSSYKVTK